MRTNKHANLATEITYAGGAFAPPTMTFSRASLDKMRRAKKAQPQFQNEDDIAKLAAAQDKRDSRAAKRSVK